MYSSLTEVQGSGTRWGIDIPEAHFRACPNIGGKFYS